jgi:hypothetical protein
MVGEATERKETLNAEIRETRRALKRCRDGSNEPTRIFIHESEGQAKKGRRADPFRTRKGSGILATVQLGWE